eukprot:scaffold38275_cov33-Tisochrysis_lutea.AAC.1
MAPVLTYTDPYSFSQLASDVTQPIHAVEAERLQSSIAEHPRHLRVFCIEGPSDKCGVSRRARTHKGKSKVWCILLCASPTVSRPTRPRVKEF